jgi:hypothetical protein
MMAQSNVFPSEQRDDTLILQGADQTKFEFGDFDHASLPFEPEIWPVTIIGSSMVGMTLGVILGYHG